MRMADRAGREKPLDSTVHTKDIDSKSVSCPTTGFGWAQIARRTGEVSPQGRGRDQSSVEQHAKTDAQTPFAQLREDERDIIVVSGQRAADAKRVVEGIG